MAEQLGCIPLTKQIGGPDKTGERDDRGLRQSQPGFTAAIIPGIGEEFLINGHLYINARNLYPSDQEKRVSPRKREPCRRCLHA